MKKIGYLLLLTALAAVFLSGCASSADSLATPTPGATGMGQGLFPGMATGTPGTASTSQPGATGMPGTGMTNNGTEAAPGGTRADARKTSQQMAEAVERLSEVDEAYVIALGDTALVGLEFGPEYQGRADDRIKKMVLARVQTVDKTVKSVAVTDDVKWMQDIQALAEALGGTAGMETIQAQMDDLVRQITVYTE